MKLRIKEIKEIEVKSIKVTVPFFEEEESVKMPFVSDENLNLHIDIDEGRIIGWPEDYGDVRFHSKVRDSGIYELLDSDGNSVLVLSDDYVPNSLLPGSYGDYLELKIDKTGKITNWKDSASLEDFEDESLDDY